MLRHIRTIILLAWTHTVFPFQREKLTNQSPQTDDNHGFNCGVRVCAKMKPLRKLQVSKVKALRFFNHCFLREDKFGAAEVNGKLQMHFASQTLCLKYTDNWSVKGKLFYWNSLLQEQIRRQEPKLKRSLWNQARSQFQETSFNFADELNWNTCVCPSFWVTSNPFAIFNLLVTGSEIDSFQWHHKNLIF